MMQRLLRQGTAGLQALDTEFVVRVELAGKLAYLLPENTLTVQSSNAVLRFAGRHLLKLSDGTIVKPALAAQYRRDPAQTGRGYARPADNSRSSRRH
jgi:hypothetical protein